MRDNSLTIVSELVPKIVKRGTPKFTNIIVDEKRSFPNYTTGNKNYRFMSRSPLHADLRLRILEYNSIDEKNCN